jgi:CII-binding regulator of phage lambda lysogenization HflD
MNYSNLTAAVENIIEINERLTAMTEQLDGLRSGIDYASDQLHKVTEQRNRMAVLLSDMQDYTKGVKRYGYSKLTLYKRMEALHDDWQEIECRIEQLLQTTPTQPEPK